MEECLSLSLGTVAKNMPLLDAGEKSNTTKVLQFRLGAGASLLEHDGTFQLEECKTQVPFSLLFHCTSSGWGGVPFFSAAQKGLRFGFVPTTVLITHQRFGCWCIVPAQHRGFLCFLPWATHSSEEPGGGQEPGRGRSRSSSPQLDKGMPHALRRLAQQEKPRDRSRRRVCSGLRCLSPQVSAGDAGALPCREWLDICQPMGSGG